MKRTRFVTYYDMITPLDYSNAESLFSESEKNELKNKMIDFKNNTKFSDFESQAAIEKAFKMGYIAAHIRYKKDDDER